MSPAYARGPGRPPPSFEIRGDKTGSGGAPRFGPFEPGRYDDYTGGPYAGTTSASRKPKGDMGFLSLFSKGKKKKDAYSSYSTRERDRVLELEAEVARFRALMDKAEETEEKPTTRLPAPSKRKMNLD